MKTLTHYGCLAERHWREFCPTMVAELEAAGRLQEMLQDALDQTAKEISRLLPLLMQQGLTEEQAQRQAWELVRERYLFLPPEN